jgi:hypothetical protein
MLDLILCKDWNRVHGLAFQTVLVPFVFVLVELTQIMRRDFSLGQLYLLLGLRKYLLAA